MTENIKSTKFVGDLAENEACKFLEKNNYKVIDRNWRTKYCEIDIVAKKDKQIYFVEVKYRKNNNYGSGLEAVTAKKQKQMQFSAELWLSKNRAKNEAYLAVISLSGEFPKVEDFLVIY